MAIILDKGTPVLIQGITGREGSNRARYMQDYGTNVVAGVTPGRGGSDVWNIPVYNSVKEAMVKHGNIECSVTFVPGPGVKDAVVEAVDAGIKKIAMPVERVPLHDTLHIVALARKQNVRVIGPGSLGIISPGRGVMGWIGGTQELAEKVFKPGNVGVMSRSGGQTTTVCWAIGEAGFGVSTAVHVGSEPVVGTNFAELLPLFQKDPDTHMVVMFGEIGTVAEEEAAQVIEQGGYTKPLVAYIAGAHAKEGVRFSHASAIIEGGRGTAQSKMAALNKVGATIVEKPMDIAPAVKKIMKR